MACPRSWWMSSSPFSMLELQCSWQRLPSLGASWAQGSLVSYNGPSSPSKSNLQPEGELHCCPTSTSLMQLSEHPSGSKPKS